jgi:hypothetical protein
MAVRCPGSEGGYAKIFEKITLSSGLVYRIMEIYAIFAVARKFGYNRRNLMGLNSGRGLHKTVY